MVRVDLPGVQVEDLRFGLVEAGAVEQPARQGVGVLAEVSAACGGYGLPEYLGGSEREFRQAGAAAGYDGVGGFRAAGDAVIVVARREDAGVPGEAQLREDIQRPERFTGDRVAGGAVAGHRGIDDAFQYLLRARGFVAEDGRCLGVNQLVAVAVGSNFMALGVDAFNQLRVALRHPAEDKEGDLDPGVVEQLQQLIRVVFHP